MKLLRLALLLLAPAPVVAQQLLDGTLFTSAEQRAYLDFLREDFLEKNAQQGFDIEESQIPDIPVDGPIGPTGPAEYNLSGIMRRSNGALTIWLNDQHLTEQELPANATVVREGNSYALRFTTSTGNRLLRPGQTLTLENGTVQERFQRPPPLTAEATAEATADTTTTAAAAETPDATDEDSADAATSVATAATAVEDANEAAADDTSETDAPDTASLVDELPDSIRNSAERIQSMIDNLQALQESISEVTDPE